MSPVRGQEPEARTVLESVLSLVPWRQPTRLTEASVTLGAKGCHPHYMLLHPHMLMVFREYF